MKKLGWKTLLMALVVTAATVAVARAEEGTDGAKPDRVRRPMVQRAGDEQDSGVDRHHPPGPFAGARQEIWELIRDSEQGQAEIERFRKELEPIHEEMKALHKTIREAIQGGQDPKEAFEAHRAEIEAVMKKRVEAAITHREKMLAIAEDYSDEAAKILTDRIGKRIEEHGNKIENRRERPERRRRPAAGDEPEEAEGE